MTKEGIHHKNSHPHHICTITQPLLLEFEATNPKEMKGETDKSKL